MKTLYTDGYASIGVDTETNTVFDIDKSFDKYEFSEVLLIQEDMHIVYRCGGNIYEADVKKGNVVILFKHRDIYQYPIVVLKDTKLAKNIAARYKEVQKIKEDWAADTANLKEAAPCCDSAKAL